MPHSAVVVLSSSHWQDCQKSCKLKYRLLQSDGVSKQSPGPWPRWMEGWKRLRPWGDWGQMIKTKHIAYGILAYACYHRNTKLKKATTSPLAWTKQSQTMSIWRPQVCLGPTTPPQQWIRPRPPGQWAERQRPGPYSYCYREQKSLLSQPHHRSIRPHRTPTPTPVQHWSLFSYWSASMKTPF